MATRIVALFNLKPGVSAEAYESWARQTDVPTVRALPSIADFAVMRATGVLGADGTPPPYAYMEIIDVADMDAFAHDIATDRMKQVAAEFQSMTDVTFITTEPVE